MSSNNPYHSCIVAECKNSSVRTPGKLWVVVPANVNMRNKWLELAGRSLHSFSLNSVLYFCEDHFDLENDMENYMQYKIMGSVKRVRMRTNCIPSRFDCMENKYCLVPKCENTTMTTPDKVFFPVPRDVGWKQKYRRQQWCKAIGSDDLALTSCLHCCEDHFDLKEDTVNYVEYESMKQQGENVRLQLKEGVVPHIFHCQKRNMPPPLDRIGAKRLALANEAPSEFADKSSNTLEETMENKPFCSQENPNHPETFSSIGETFIAETQNGNSNNVSEISLNDIKSEPLEEEYITPECTDEIKSENIKIDFEEHPVASGENVPAFMPCTRQILPKINMFSIVEYLVQNDSYKDIDYRKLKSDIDINAEDTIGFVQLHTMDNKVTLQGTVAFDRHTAHVCIVKYDSSTDTVDYTNCECQQLACQHILAFLMWLHRRSEEQLDNNMSFCIEPLVQQTKFLKAKDIVYKSDTDSLSEDLDISENVEQNEKDIVQEFVSTCREMNMFNSPLYRYLNGYEFLELSLHRLVASWRSQEPALVSPCNFLHYCTQRMAGREDAIAELATYVDYALRQKLQYGRVEGQHIFDAYLPELSDQKNLVDTILSPDMHADDEFTEMMRKTLEEQLNLKIKKCGIILSKEYPMFCAVPYGLTDTHVIDIIHVANRGQMADYMQSNVLKPSIEQRVQLNMLLAKKEKAYFFIGIKGDGHRTTKLIHIHEIKFKKTNIVSILKRGIRFWENNVFNQILSGD